MCNGNTILFLKIWNKHLGCVRVQVMAMGVGFAKESNIP